MSKEERKKIELELVLAAEEILSRTNTAAVGKIRKRVKATSRELARKFLKAVKAMEKKKPAAKKPAAKKKPAVKKKRGRPATKAKAKK